MLKPEDDQPERLDEGERAYLAAFLAVHTPSDAQTQAGLAEVEERIAAGEHPAGFDEAEATTEQRSRWRPVVVMGGVALALAAAVVLVMRLDVTAMLASEAAGSSPDAAVYAGQDSGDVEQAVSRRPRGGVASASAGAREPEPAPEESKEPEAAPPEVDPPEVEVEPRPRTHRPSRRTPPAEQEPEAKPAPTDATLHAELALLRPAQKALRSGDHARALRLLDDHAKSFPRSVLAPERSLGRIQALCGLGRGQEARRMIVEFGQRHPGSPLTGRVNKACPAEESP